jgi:glycosyltransferase involved in cell wall biosynthesis
MLSIIIPLHNETQRLPEAMTKLKAFRYDQWQDMEVLLIDNGSTDGTQDMINWYAQRYPWVDGAVIKERGKGAAVAVGMLAARGDILYMADVDFSTPLSELSRMMYQLIDHDVVIGSRELDRGRVTTSITRRVIGRMFHELISGLVPGYQDTQCGFKLFKRHAARRLFSQLRITGLAFDVELLYLARRAGYSIKELPVQWRQDKDSRVRLGVDSLQMLRDVLSIPNLHARDLKLPA